MDLKTKKELVILRVIAFGCLMLTLGNLGLYDYFGDLRNAFMCIYFMVNTIFAFIVIYHIQNMEYMKEHTI